MDNLFIQSSGALILALLCVYFFLTFRSGYQFDFAPNALPKDFDLEKGPAVME